MRFPFTKKKPTSKPEPASRTLGRRSLIKWSLATGAAYGLEPWQVFEVLEDSGGKALAQDAACLPANRSVHIIAGTGGFAWFTLLWPHVDVAAAANPAASWHAPGEEVSISGTARPLTLGPEAPWQFLPGSRQVTALMAGTNETHTNTPSSNSSVAMNTGLFAACAAVQTAAPTLTPVVAVNGSPYRNAAGAPRVAQVGSANDIVSLFNSAASRAGGLLSTTENAELFSTSYSAWMRLRAAAGQPTMRSGVAAGTTSARLIGTNLADALAVTQDDLDRYGVSATSRTQVMEFARTLIVTAKAFRHGLTNSVILPAMRDDPHGAFADMPMLRRTVRELGSSLDAFYRDLEGMDDPNCSGSIADNTVISIHGDTPKNPLTRANWPDGTPGNSNWLYVLGGGQLQTGWFGGIDRAGNVSGWDPTTGNPASMDTAATATAGAAAVLYSVCKGDMRRVRDFYRGVDINGIVTDVTV